MKRLVFDEWVWADLNGENGEEAQRKTFLLLQAVFKKCDQLVTVQGSPFLHKYFGMAKQARMADPRRTIVKVFKVQLLENSEQLQLLQECSLAALPSELEYKVKEDDKYLVGAYLAVEADLLVTTDNPLMEALNGSCIRCQDKDTFISDYLENDPTCER